LPVSTPLPGARTQDLTPLVALRPTVEALAASDGHIWFLRGGADAAFVVEDAAEADRAVVARLETPASVGELEAAAAAAGCPRPRAYVQETLAQLRAAGLVGDVRPLGAGLSAEHAERYARQLVYFAGEAGEEEAAALQQRLLDARVVVLGCGGLGTWTASALACAGVGALVLVDGDTVALGNLNRQVLFRRADVGRPKVEAAAEALRAFDPSLAVDARRLQVGGPEDVAALLPGADLVIALADEPPHLLNRWVDEACAQAGVPHTSAGQFPPVVKVGPLVVPGRTGCLACQEEHARRRFGLYDELVAYRLGRRPAAATLGATSGAVGSLLAMDAIHLLTGLAEPATLGRTVLLDLRTLTVSSEAAVRLEDCPRCRSAPGS